MTHTPHKIVFFGTSEFAVPILERLAASPYRPSLVVTAPDKPAGRGQEVKSPPVKLVAQKFGISFIQPGKLEIRNSELEISGADLFIVAAYGKILPAELLSLPKHGALNVHPSLLPRWRGPSPVQYSILNGDEETGVTIMLMDEKADHGPILKFKNLNIESGKWTAPELKSKLAEMGAELILDVTLDWLDGKIAPVPQNEAQATYANMLKKEDGKIDWRKSSEEIERMVRAFQPWPGTFAFWHQGNNRIRLIVEEADSGKLAGDALQEPGKVSAIGGELLVAAGCGNLAVKHLKPEGKRSMTSAEFLKGHRDIIGSVLE